MKFEDIFNNVDTIEKTTDYWFVRTDSGDYFETFYEKNFIGIGWNEVTKNDLLHKTEAEIKLKIARANNYDVATSKGRTRITSAYNKIIKFSALKENDVIVIPSNGSAELAFGIIKDTEIYTEVDAQLLGDCKYFKRRKIEWKERKNIHSLDSTFYQIVRPWHAISDIKKYANYIDNVIETLYQKEEEDGKYAHFVLDIDTKNDIDMNSLLDLMESIRELSKSINTSFGFNEEEPISIKLNVNSPGKAEVKRKIGKTLLVLATLFASCKNDGIQSTGNRKLDDFAGEKPNVDSLNKANKAMKVLQINIDKINNR